MEDIEFTEQELEYINANICDNTKNVYINKHNVFCLSTYEICCKNLPKGEYYINDTVNFPMQEISRMIFGYYKGKLKDKNLGSGHLSFTILDNCSFSLKPEYWHSKKSIQNIIRSLRTQAVINTRNLNKDSLIQQDINAHTDLDKPYENDLNLPQKNILSHSPEHEDILLTK